MISISKFRAFLPGGLKSLSAHCFSDQLGDQIKSTCTVSTTDFDPKVSKPVQSVVLQGIKDVTLIGEDVVETDQIVDYIVQLRRSNSQPLR